MEKLVDIAARRLRKTPEGQLFYAAEDVAKILEESLPLGRGAELYDACRGLVEFAAYLLRTNGARAAQMLATEVLPPLAMRLAAPQESDHFREQARQLARLSSESSSTSGAFARPSSKGARLRRP